MGQDAKIVHVNVKRTSFARVAEATMTAKYSKSLGYFSLPCVLPALPPPAKADLWKNVPFCTYRCGWIVIVMFENMYRTFLLSPK